MKINQLVKDRNKKLYENGVLFLLLIVVSLMIDRAEPSLVAEPRTVLTEEHRVAESIRNVGRAYLRVAIERAVLNDRLARGGNWLGSRKVH